MFYEIMFYENENPCVYCGTPIYDEEAFCSKSCKGWWDFEDQVFTWCETLFRLMEPDYTKWPEVPF